MDCRFKTSRGGPLCTSYQVSQLRFLWIFQGDINSQQECQYRNSFRRNLVQIIIWRFWDTEVLTDCWDFSQCGCSPYVDPERWSTASFLLSSFFLNIWRISTLIMIIQKNQHTTWHFHVIYLPETISKNIDRQQWAKNGWKSAIKIVCTSGWHDYFRLKD